MIIYSKFNITIILFVYFYNKIATILCINCENHECKNECYVLDNDKQLCLCNENEKGIHCKETWNICEQDCNINNATESCSVALCKQGTCIPTANKPYYKCECGDFFQGANCEIENNPCSFPETNPCLNGKCIFITKLNRIICECNNGWTQKNQQNPSMLPWGKQTVEVSPPCDEPVKKGLSQYVIHYTPATYTMWWLIYIISVLVLFLCCCNMCFSFFSNSILSYFSIFGNKKNS
ncbi:EGF-like membrane protein, putative [Plasmodium chabaudi adami]|uniref:EGF-like membrane protein, putative n=1 Tax=Plasmodium chabaudi adami TaxID=5826 RepID=A0A1C6YGL7_PLACE|nr:EGF-like membrane protein, putative [Plasmodium chabaudi adami]SCN61186.1 EGF-like membrane protein, putative [Plasmodium chabaudi adami]